MSRRSNGSPVPDRQLLKRGDVLEADRQNARVEMARGLAELGRHVVDAEFGFKGDLPRGDDADRQLRVGIEQQRAQGGRSRSGWRAAHMSAQVSRSAFIGRKGTAPLPRR